MAFFRRWLLILFTLVLGGGPLFAASREDRAFAAASAALQDGIYDRAEMQFAQFIRRFPKSERVPEALLAQARAQFNQGKYAAAADLLTARAASSGSLADQFAYWLGEAQFAKGDFTSAAETFSSLAKNFQDSPLRLTAMVEAAAAFQRLGDWPQLSGLLGATNGVFARAAALDSANEMVSRGRLLLAQAQFAQGNLADAVATLKAFNQEALAPDLEWQRASLLCRATLAAGDADAALALTTNLLQTARLQNDAARKADSLALRALVLEKKKLLPEAVVAWSENLTGNAPLERQREAVLKIAALAVAQNEFANSTASLEKYLAQFSNSPAAELALLTLGELQLKDFMATVATDQLAAAQTNFDRFIGTFTNSPLTGKAFLDRGWCRWLAAKNHESGGDIKAAAQKYAASFDAFKTAAQSANLPPEDLAVARFKMGDALFALANYAGALTNYGAALDDFTNFPAVAGAFGDRALYQMLRANLELTNMDGAGNALAQIQKQFPSSNLAPGSQLLLGEAFSDFGQPEKAREVLEPFAGQYPDSVLVPQAELAVARTFESETNWPAAIKNYEAWLKNHPTNDLLPQVQYALARANDKAGRETNAFELFTAFAARFPADTNAPLAQWWVADHFYRAGSFVGAETNYELIFQTPAWKNSTLFYEAQLMAGRAAVGRLGFLDAANYLTKLVGDTNCPPALATRAMFAYGGVLMRMDSPDTNRPFANFELATNVFTQIVLANSTNELGALAGSELGDCNLQLGALDAAAAAYAQVTNSPYASVGLRSRAQVGLGRVLEKKAEVAPPEARKVLLDLALKNYLDVFETSYGNGLGDNEQADAFWVAKAGLQALPLMSAGSCPTNFFTRMESLLPPLKDALEKKKAALKK